MWTMIQGRRKICCYMCGHFSSQKKRLMFAHAHEFMPGNAPTTHSPLELQLSQGECDYVCVFFLLPSRVGAMVDTAQLADVHSCQTRSLTPPTPRVDFMVVALEGLPVQRWLPMGGEVMSWHTNNNASYYVHLYGTRYICVLSIHKPTVLNTLNILYS